MTVLNDPIHFFGVDARQDPYPPDDRGMLLGCTEWIEATDVGEWLPSILVRRLERLELACE